MNQEWINTSGTGELQSDSGKRLTILSILLFVFINWGYAQTHTLKSSSISNGSQKATSASYSINSSVGQTITGAAQSGSYQLTAGFLPTSIPRQAELTLQSSMNISPAEVAPGGTTSLTFTLYNSGAVDIFGAISAEVYLSVNNIFEAGDSRLDSFGIVTDLAAGATLSYPQGANTKSLTIPQSTAVGSYYILVILKTENPINEINSDNSFSKALTVSNVPSGGDTQAPLFSNTPTSGTFSPSKISITVSDASEVTVSLQYRPFSGEGFSSAPMENTSGQTYEISLLDEWADELGMEGYIIAEDEFGNNSESGTFLLHRSNTSNSAIPFTGADFDGKAKSYKMFSVPYDLTNKRFEDIFNALGAYDKNVWRIFRYQNGGYVELQSGLANSISLGNGYWFNTTRKDFIIDVGEGEVSNQITATSPFSMSFQQGWNQIGNPYPFPVSWQAIQDANPDRGLGSLFVYENGSYQNATTLNPWEGAFVFCDAAGTVTFPLTAKASGRVATETPDFDWKLDVTLQLNGRRHTGAVGMHHLARPGKDRFDEIMVPRFISYPEMTTHHPEYFAHGFASDFVPTADYHEWTFDLLASDQEGTATLSWDREVFKNLRGKCFLLDLSSLKVTDMSLVGTFQFEWENGRQVSIVYTTDGTFRPCTNRIGLAWPNPFSDHIKIPILVKDETQALQVTIFDSQGRTVRNLTQSFTKGGLYFYEWDGKDTNGHEVSEGVYFYRLELSGDQKVSRIIKN